MLAMIVVIMYKLYFVTRMHCYNFVVQEYLFYCDTSSLLCLHNNKYLKTDDLSVPIVIPTSIDLPVYSQYTRLFPV